jgi:hypothetical protein
MSMTTMAIGEETTPSGGPSPMVISTKAMGEEGAPEQPPDSGSGEKKKGTKKDKKEKVSAFSFHRSLYAMA